MLLPLPGMWVACWGWVLSCGHWPFLSVDSGGLDLLLVERGLCRTPGDSWVPGPLGACSWLTPGWSVSSGVDCISPLVMSILTPCRASLPLLLGWICRCYRDVRTQVFGTLGGCRWYGCPGSISFCLWGTDIAASHPHYQVCLWQRHIQKHWLSISHSHPHSHNKWKVGPKCRHGRRRNWVLNKRRAIYLADKTWTQNQSKSEQGKS